MLGGAGGKSFKGKKNASEEKKRAHRPGDLPPRRGRAWNPGAGPRPERSDMARDAARGAAAGPRPGARRIGAYAARIRRP